MGGLCVSWRLSPAVWLSWILLRRPVGAELCSPRPHPSSYIAALPANVTALEERASKEVAKGEWGHAVGPDPTAPVSLERRGH